MSDVPIRGDAAGEHEYGSAVASLFLAEKVHRWARVAINRSSRPSGLFDVEGTTADRRRLDQKLDGLLAHDGGSAAAVGVGCCP